MSFIQVQPESDFSYENLPYGIFSTPENVKEFIMNLFFNIISYSFFILIFIRKENVLV